jgi:protein-tyrosine phosphatase
MTALPLAEVAVGAGRAALCPMPGSAGGPVADLATILAWQPGLVLSLATADEMAARGAAGLGAALAAQGVAWRHMPVADFGVPGEGFRAAWPDVEAEALALLARGGRVLAHCMGGCGRSGMVVLRLMVASGEPAAAALDRLRRARPCAVETPGQRDWAARG